MSKIIEIYIENEKVDQFFVSEEFFPKHLLEFFLSKNPKIIEITNFDKMPKYNMIWDGEKFIFSEENKNLTYENLMDLEDIKTYNSVLINERIESSNIIKTKPINLRVLALLDGNVFKESLNLEEELDEKQYAIYMSNPRFEIKELND